MNILFSIIITFYEKNDYLKKCLEKLNEQTFKNFEVILISEKKIELDRYKYKLKFKHTKNIKNPGEKRNIASKLAKGKILAFLDDDAFPDKNWLLNAKNFFKKKKSDFYCLGGPGILPKDENFFGRSANLFNISKIFYPFPERYASINEKKFQNYDDWPSVNLFVSRKIFIKIGGFDPKYWPGEDSKLCEKLINKKIKILYDPGVITYHYKRSKLTKHLNQNFRYGYHRGKFFIEGDQNSRRFIFILPSLFLLYNLFVFLIPSKVFMIPLILYISLLLFDLKNSIKYDRNILVLFYSRIIFYITHNAYGLGFLTSLLSKKYKLNLGR